MNIAYLCQIYPHTTHTFIRREIKALEELSLNVHPVSIRRSTEKLVTPEDREEFDRTFVVLDGNILNFAKSIASAFLTSPLHFCRMVFRAVRMGWRSDAGLLRHCAYAGEACVVKQHLDAHGIEHVHSHFGTNATTVALLIKELGGPGFSFTIHGPGEWDCPRFIHLPEKVEAARFVAVISDFAKSQTFRWTAPDQWHKVHVVRCGVDTAYLDQPITPVKDVRQFIMIGRLGRSKGHVILLDAAEKLREEGLEFTVKLIGDGELRTFIEEEIRLRGLSEHILMTGWMDNNEVRREILDSRALVLPSFGEGLPVSIMETLCLGRPVICTRIAGISELVVDGENGWLVNSGNADELANAIREVLLAPPERLSALGQAGRARVQQKHDVGIEAGKLAKYLRSVASPG